MNNQLLSKLSLLRKNSLRLGLMLALGTVTSSAIAQTTLTIGNGTGTTTNTPIKSYYGYTYSQNIYLAADMLAAGGAANLNITKIRFYYSGGATDDSNNWTVYVGHTNKNSFANNSDWEVIGNLTSCFSGTVTFPAAGNWMEITLTTPFEWNGTQNIIIGVDENAPSYADASPGAAWRITTTANARSLYYYADGTNPNPATPPTTAGGNTLATANSYPNVQLVMVPDCSGTPVHSPVTMTADTVCPLSTTELSLDPSYNGFAGMTYQWQVNDGSGWTSIPTATSPTYTTPAITEAIEYRAIVGCSYSMESDTTDTAAVALYTPPTLSLTSTDIAVCTSDPANVSVSGASTYIWSPTNQLSPSATADTVTLIPSVQTTYTVIGTDAYGCKDTATVKVTPVTSVAGIATYSPSEICEPGAPVTISIEGLPAEITSGGQWQYRWLGPDGTTELQPWNTTDDFQFIPTEDSVYSFFYQLQSSSCPPDDYLDSVRVDVVVGFGADVAVTHYDCNAEGTIVLSDIFGQKNGVLYTNDFADADGAAVLSGNASLTAGRAVLTPSAGTNSGYLQINTPPTTVNDNRMKVSFKMTVDQPLSGGADGITYSFGDDATPTANGSARNGRGTKLRLSFDSFANPEENGNATGIYLVYGWTANNAFGPASAQTVAYSTNTGLWRSLTDVPVILDITADGKATVTVNGTVVFNNIQLPAAYLSEDVANWKHLFSAETGGSAFRHAIDNLEINSASAAYGITSGAGTTIPPTEWQSGTTFTDLLPGVYNVWISKDTTATCSKNIGAFEVLNTNPIVDLGNDTTICEGETIILDAGNPGSDYIWSGTNAFTQTVEVGEEGPYVAYVTNPAGCLGIGTINVEVEEAPSATGISGSMIDFTGFFSATGAQNVDNYSWDFGDGETIANGPASVTHTYDDYGTYTVTLTVSNDCGEEEFEFEVEIIDYTSLSENSIAGLEVYPNPAKDQVTIFIPNNQQSEVRVFNMAGAQILAGEAFTSSMKLDVATWEKGVYFLHISNEGQTTISKLIVQ